MSKSSSTAPPPRLLKQPTNLKRGLMRSRVLSGNKQTRDATSTTKLNNKTDSRPPDQIVSSSSFTEETIPMEMDDPQDKTLDTVNIQNPTLVPQESSFISNRQSDQIYQVSVLNKPPVPASTDTSVSSDTSVKETGMVTGGHPVTMDMTGTSVAAVQSKAVPSAHLSEPDTFITNKTSVTLPCSQPTNSPALASSAAASAPSTSLCVWTKEPDPSKIVSLKIILSDEQDGQSSDVALNQAVSSITGDRIPTIFLSSPAKSLPTASAVITQEETAQAVNTLQGMETVGSFGTPTRSILSNVQAVARPVGQETGFIQLLPANPSYGLPGSYFVVTDPTTSEQRSNVVLVPNTVSQGTVSSTPHVVATPPRQRTVVSMGPNISQTYTPGE